MSPFPMARVAILRSDGMSPKAIGSGTPFVIGTVQSSTLRRDLVASVTQAKRAKSKFTL